MTDSMFETLDVTVTQPCRKKTFDFFLCFLQKSLVFCYVIGITLALNFAFGNSALGGGGDFEALNGICRTLKNALDASFVSDSNLLSVDINLGKLTIHYLPNHTPTHTHPPPPPTPLCFLETQIF